MTVVVVLIGILLPGLATVREATRRVVCSSNVRQLGIGIALFAEDHIDTLPASVFAESAGGPNYAPHETVTVRRESPDHAWDGLGLLYRDGYLDASGVFYCPSHTGEHPFARYAGIWPADNGEVVSNFQYRGYVYQDGTVRSLQTLMGRNPTLAVLTDGLRTQDEYNHKVGCNVLRSNLSVSWFHDRTHQLVDGLPMESNEPLASDKVQGAWIALDRPPR